MVLWCVLDPFWFPSKHSPWRTGFSQSPLTSSFSRGQSTRCPRQAPSRLCFWMGRSSVKNDHPSSCFNRCFSRPWSDVNSLVKSLQLCPLHTPFLSPYDMRKSLVHKSASLLGLRAFWAVFPSAYESPKELVKTVDSALRCVRSDSVSLGWRRRFCISLSF